MTLKLSATPALAPLPLALTCPSKEQIAALEPFELLRLDQICVPSTPQECSAAVAELLTLRFIGFDTESKPTFHKGEAATGPHVVQFSSAERAYVFQSWRPGCLAAIKQLLEAPALVKVGFGLQTDLLHLYERFGVQTRSVLDMDQVFLQRGYRRNIGVKAAIAVVFNKRFAKSKRATTSNWAARHLEPRLLLYAGNDAYAAIRVLQASDLPRTSLPLLQ